MKIGNKCLVLKSGRQFQIYYQWMKLYKKQLEKNYFYKPWEKSNDFETRRSLLRRPTDFIFSIIFSSFLVDRQFIWVPSGRLPDCRVIDVNINSGIVKVTAWRFPLISPGANDSRQRRWVAGAKRAAKRRRCQQAVRRVGPAWAWKVPRGVQTTFIIRRVIVLCTQRWPSDESVVKSRIDCASSTFAPGLWAGKHCVTR